MTPESRYRLSPLQQGMLLHHILRPRSGVDIAQLVGTLHEAIDPVALREAWKRALARHAVLRTSFRWQGSPEPVQEVQRAVDLPFSTEDWRSPSEDELEERRRRFLLNDRRQGFDLEQAPLLRLSLIRTGETRYDLIFTFHHIILDGRSFPIVLQEVFEDYEAISRGKRLTREPPPSFRQYIDWLDHLDLGPAERFWRERLKGFTTPTPLPAAFAVEAAETGSQGALVQRVNRATTAALQDLARRVGVTLNTLVQGAWAILLARHSGEDNVVFGATRAGRRATVPDADRMVGFFINTIPVRVRLDWDASLRSWLGELRTTWRELGEYEQAPLATIQKWSEIPGGTPLFHTLLVFENYHLDAYMRTLGGAWENREIRMYGQTGYPLTLSVFGGDELAISLEYDRSRCDDGTAARLASQLDTLLAGMGDADPDRPISALPWLPPAERSGVERWLRPELVAGDSTCLHQRFEAAAKRFPDAIALTFERTTLTYGELDRRSNVLAHRLRRLGVGPDVLVGLACERSLALVVGILGILKAGGAYLPLDPSYPTERLRFMVDDSAVNVVVTQSSLLDKLPSGPTKLLLDDGSDLDGLEQEGPPATGVSPANLAYVIYTSGSTGRPKGVLITHRNVSRLMDATWPWFRFDEQDVWTLFHSYAFDFSVWELWGALAYGGRLVVVPYWVSRSPEAFLELLEREGVSVLNQTPSAFRQLMTVAVARNPRLALREVIFGGEALEPPTLEPWYRKFGIDRPRLVNMYGITETTVHVTYRPLCADDIRSGRGSMIGRPIPDLTMSLLNRHGQPVPIGTPGELYVGGGGVARGYLNRAELTSERFVSDSSGHGARLYRTGDLARFHPDGDLEYLGRIDDQVKIRGFRIELGEIESVLRSHPGVHEAVVVCRDGGSGEKRLIGYVTCNGAEVDSSDLRSYLVARLPEYMVPARVIALERFPLTSNGKLDRSALPAPEQLGQVQRTDHVAPRNPKEEALARIWSEVLRIPRVGVHDNYYELGGDSILSIQIAARAREAGLPLSVTMLGKHLTIAELAEALEQVTATPVALPLTRSGPAPLTPIQRWFFELDPAEPNHWNQAFLFRTEEDLGEATLRDAIAAVMERHEALRLRFARVDGAWRQTVDSSCDPPLWIEDLSQLSDPALAEGIAAIAGRAARSLDFQNGPCFRIAYLRLGAGRRNRLLLAIHHLVVDGVSWRILLEDLDAAYRNRLAEQPGRLPARDTSFLDWAGSLGEAAQERISPSERDYWTRISQAPVLSLPGPRDVENPVGESGTLLASLTVAETADLLQRVPAAYATQVNEVLLAAVSEALGQWIGEGDLLVHLEGHGREPMVPGTDLTRTVGWFTSMFPFRLPLATEGDIGRRLKGMKEAVRAVPQRGIGYGILRYLTRDPDLANQPRPELVFNYLGQFDQLVAGSSLLRFAPEDPGPWYSPRGRRPYLLEINSLILNGRLEFRWTFARRWQDEAVIQQLAGETVTALRRIIQHCQDAGVGGRSPSDFPLVRLTQEQVDRLAGDGRNAEDIGPLAPLQRLFIATGGASGDVGFEQWRLEIEGPLDEELFRRAWERVSQRHGILRTAFHSSGLPMPVQVILRETPLSFVLQDWRSLDRTDQARRMDDLLSRDREQGFELDRAPLHRLALIRTGETRWTLVWSNHHLLLDRWSWPIVLNDVGLVYRALCEGREPELPASVPWRRYLAWLAEQDQAAAEAFWSRELSGVNPARLRRLPGAGAGKGGEERLDLSREDGAALSQLARGLRVTLNTIVAAAWAIWLGRRTELSEVVYGVTVSGRPEAIPGIDRLVGMCINNLPVRVRLDPAEPIRDFLLRIDARQASVGDFSHSDPLEVQRWSGLPWHQRLFETLLVFQHHGAEEDSASWIGDSARVRFVPVETRTNYPLALTVGGKDAVSLRLA
ncbi:MAG: amino acid adenylation domain-containing protein, partial [Gemmatimonadales bacterium]